MNALKSDHKYLRKLYAVLLLAAISISILPVNLLHSHEGEDVLVSGKFTDTQQITTGHQLFCPVCSCVLTQHYLPARAWETFVYSFPFSHAVSLQESHLPATFHFISLRAPPAC